MTWLSLTMACLSSAEAVTLGAASRGSLGLSPGDSDQAGLERSPEPAFSRAPW